MSEETLKVLSICTSFIGGAGRAAFRIHQGVRSLGVDSCMLTKSGQSNDPNIIVLDQFAPKNPFYKVYNWTRNKFENKLQHLEWSRYPQKENVFLSDLRSVDSHGVLNKLDFDVLHMHWVNLRFMPLKELPKDKPIVWTLHDSWPFCGICHYFLDCEEYKRQCGKCPFLNSDKVNDLSHRIWKKKALIYKDLDLHIVTPSRWLGECVEQSGLLGRFPISVIPNCLNTQMFRKYNEVEISPKWNDLKEIRTARKLILFGAINAATDKVKGFPYLVSALRILEQSGRGEGLALVVFGANGNELKVDVNIPVHYVGYVNDTQELASLYNLADVTVVPSLSENLSCVIMESLSCGTPVSAFNIGGNGDLIEHQRNGYLSKPFDSVDLAHGIMWCLENNNDNRLGKAAREKVMSSFDLKVVCKSYVDLYNSVWR